MRGVIRGVLVSVLAVVVCLPVTARPSHQLIAAMRAGDEGTVALELSLGADLGPAIAASAGVRPNIMALLAQQVLRSLPAGAAGLFGTAGRADTGLLRAVGAGDMVALRWELASGVDPRGAIAQVGEAVSPRVMEMLVTACRCLYEPAYDTPLMAAARCGGCSQAAGILASGADPNARHPITGLTARQIAETEGNAGVAAILMAYEAGVEVILGHS